jgi:3-oxoacyl-[acyl-carrier protein] reductase
MEERSSSTGQSLEQIECEAVKNLPMGHYQAPEECGAVVAFLASKWSSGITGSDIRVDGGLAKRI